MEKTFEINISNIKLYNVKESFEYFETYDFTKLKFNSDTKDVKLINNTLSIRNLNNIKGYIFHNNRNIENIVGYIKNIKLNDNMLYFDLVFMNTVYGNKYKNENNIGFDITFSKSKQIKLDTNGSYADGAILTTDDKSIFIINILINNKKINTITVI